GLLFQAEAGIRARNVTGVQTCALPISSWITGPAFVGLRQLAVDVASDIWVLDLGGEGRGARKEDNVFAIQSPVAIVTLVRKGKEIGRASWRERVRDEVGDRELHTRRRQ